MDQEVTDAECQIAWAALRIGKPAFSFGELRELASKRFLDELLDWTGAFEHLVERSVLKKDGDIYAVTPEGVTFIENVMSAGFVDVLLRCEQSKAYGHFCELVYGKDLRQFSMVDMEQLAKLINVLGMNEQSRAVDLGCGIGQLAEYISDVTGANITAIDFAEKMIEVAKARTVDKAERLTFQAGNLNNLDLTHAAFDAVISIDTLYFVKDLQRTVGQMKALLKPDGRLGIFYSQTIEPEDSRELLEPNRTKLAEALKACDLLFTAYEFTANEARIWQRGRKILDELKPEFEAEGNEKLHQERIEETETILRLVNDGRTRRYLYCANLA